MIVYDRVESDDRIELLGQSKDERIFVRELAAILASGGTIRLFANEDTAVSFFSISFDGGVREPTTDEAERTKDR